MMKIILSMSLFILSNPVLAGCLEKINPKPLPTKRAELFKIYKGNNFYAIKIGDQTSWFYKGEKSPCAMEISTKIPIQNIIPGSTSHIAFLELLNRANIISGFSSLNLVSSKMARKRITEKKIVELGFPSSLEKMISLQPQLVLALSPRDTSVNFVTKLNNVGIPVVHIKEYLEKSPLSRAEWIKIFGIFIDNYEESKTIFDNIVENYNELKAKVSLKKSVSVLIGNPSGGAWESPGGQSDFIQMVKDAGASPILVKESRNSVKFNMEKVLMKQDLAKFWILRNMWTKKSDILNDYSGLRNFRSFKGEKVYNSHGIMTKAQGWDFWETGLVRPDLVLKDLVSIFHPELVKHEKIWFKVLK